MVSVHRLSPVTRYGDERAQEHDCDGGSQQKNQSGVVRNHGSRGVFSPDPQSHRCVAGRSSVCRCNYRARVDAERILVCAVDFLGNLQSCHI